MQSYKDLVVYKRAHRFAVEIHKMTLNALPGFEMFEEGNQIRRSSKSIPATIVEGFGRKQYQQEYYRYLTYAIASADETREHLELLFETGSFQSKEQFESLLKDCREVGKMLCSLRASVKKDL